MFRRVEYACFALWIVWRLALGGNCDFDGEGLRFCWCGVLGFVDGGEEAGGVVDAARVGADFLGGFLRDGRCFWCGRYFISRRCS